MDESELRNEIKQLWHTLHGNGEAGFLERVRLLELTMEQQDARFTRLDKAMEGLQKVTSDLVKYRETQAAEWRGFKKAMYVFGAILTFLIAGGYSAVVATLRVALNGG